MPNLTLVKSLSFSSANSLGIAPNSSDSFFIAYMKSNNELKVEKVSVDKDGKYSTTSLNAPGECTMSPALVTFNNKLYAFYRKKDKDLSNDKDFKYRRYTLPTDTAWSSEHSISGAKASSDHNPVITVFNNEIWLIDKNNTHHFIAEAWMDNKEAWSTNKNTTYWISDDNKKKDWGYQTASEDKKNGGKKQEHDQILSKTGGNPITPRNPSMVVFKDKIYAAYKGGRVSGDSTAEQLYIMTADSKHVWTNPVNFLSGEKSIFAPALAVVGNTLFCVFARDGHSNHLYYATSTNGSTWSAVTKISDKTLNNGKATDPFAMGVNKDQLAISYVNGGSARLKIFKVS